MNSHTVRAIQLPQHRTPGGLPLPVHLLVLIGLLCVAFVALWIATVADSLHPYGKPAHHK